MTDLNLVADILKIGFSGFAFLMVYLAYRLLAEEQKRADIRIDLVKQVDKFRNFTIIFAGLVLGSVVVERAVAMIPGPSGCSAAAVRTLVSNYESAVGKSDVLERAEFTARARDQFRKDCPSL